MGMKRKITKENNEETNSSQLPRPQNSDEQEQDDQNHNVSKNNKKSGGLPKLPVKKRKISMRANHHNDHNNSSNYNSNNDDDSEVDDDNNDNDNNDENDNDSDSEDEGYQEENQGHRSHLSYAAVVDNHTHTNDSNNNDEDGDEDDDNNNHHGQLKQQRNQIVSSNNNNIINISSIELDYSDPRIDLYGRENSVSNSHLDPVRPGIIDVSKCNMHEHRWDRMYELLVQQEAIYGSCKIPLSYEVTNPDGSIVKLGLWLGTQRQLHRKGQLRKDKLDRLQVLVDTGKMDWGEVKLLADDVRWNAMFDCLVKYCETNGHCNVPERYIYVSDNGEKLKLGRWLDRQRGIIKRNKMRPDRMARFQLYVDQGLLIQDTLGEDERKWNWCYEALVAYGLEHGNCNVPHGYVIKLPNGSMAKLGVWLSTQRHLQKRLGKLRPDRAMKLQELVDRGMLKWGDIQLGKDQKWELCYAALLQYDIDHGDMDMSRMYESTLADGSRVKLHKWLNKQITAYKDGKLKMDRQLRLQELVNAGKISWEIRSDNPWMDQSNQRQIMQNVQASSQLIPRGTIPINRVSMLLSPVVSIPALASHTMIMNHQLQQQQQQQHHQQHHHHQQQQQDALHQAAIRNHQQQQQQQHQHQHSSSRDDSRATMHHTDSTSDSDIEELDEDQVDALMHVAASSADV